MRILLLFAALLCAPIVCQAGHMRNYGRYSVTQSRYAQAHNRTDYANGYSRHQYQYQHQFNTGGYTNANRYPSSWWGPSNPSYSAGYRLGRALRGR